jgi:hypothetical protein
LGCWEVYTCETQTGFCSQCYETCVEQDSFSCYLATPCEWAAIPSHEETLASAPSSLVHLLQPAP